MPSLKIHCNISKERTKGKDDFKELHKWIDAPQKEKGINHRTERHAFNLKEKNYIQKKWGKRAVIEWMFHIAIDNLETAFKMADKRYTINAYNFFRFGLTPNSEFIFFDFDKLNERGLKNEFGDSCKIKNI